MKISQEAYELINEIEANIRKAKNKYTNNTKTKKTTKYSGMGQMIPSLIDMDNLVTPDKLNSFEKGLSDFGTAIGCPILFFNNKKAKNIRRDFLAVLCILTVLVILALDGLFIMNLFIR